MLSPLSAIVNLSAALYQKWPRFRAARLIPRIRRRKGRQPLWYNTGKDLI